MCFENVMKMWQVHLSLKHSVIYLCEPQCNLLVFVSFEQHLLRCNVCMWCYMFYVSGGNCLWPRWQLIASVPRTEWLSCVTDVSSGRCLSYLSLWSRAWFRAVNIAMCLFGHSALCTPVMPTAVDQECKYKVLWTVQAELSNDYYGQAISEGWSSLSNSTKFRNAL